MNSKLITGIRSALIASLISGFSVWYNKQLITGGIDTTILNLVKNGGAGILFSLAILKIPGFIPSVRKSFHKLLLMALVGGSIPFILFFEGLKMTPAVNANFIHKTMFVWVALLAVSLLKERLSLIQICGYILIIAANFAVGKPSFTFSTGEMMIMAATLLWSGENILSKIFLKDFDYRILAWSRMFLGSLIIFLYALLGNKFVNIIRIPPQQLLPLTGSIMLLSLYVHFWMKSLSLMPAALVTSVLTIAVPVTTIVTALSTSPTVSANQIGTAVLISTGVLLTLPVLSLFRNKTISHD